MPAPNAKPPTPKKAPGGIPIWGWVAAGIAGLVIAYMITRKSGAASQDAGTESGANPLGLSDSVTGGGVVAPPPPGTSPPPGGSDTTGQTGTTIQDVITTITDPGNTTTTTNPVIGPTDVFGNPVNLTAADSSFPNAGFETSPYVAPSGNVVVGPGGPVIDIGEPAPYNSTIPVYSYTAPNPNVLSPGAVIDAITEPVIQAEPIPRGADVPVSPPEIGYGISGPPPPTTVLPHGQVVS